jgi:hypothetical protein
MCFSCCSDDAFMSEVSRSGRKQVLLCGRSKPTFASRKLRSISSPPGIRSMLPRNAVSSRTQPNWQIGLNRTERAGGILTSTEAAVVRAAGEKPVPRTSRNAAVLQVTAHK